MPPKEEEEEKEEGGISCRSPSHFLQLSHAMENWKGSIHLNLASVAKGSSKWKNLGQNRDGLAKRHLMGVKSERERDQLSVERA